MSRRLSTAAIVVRAVHGAGMSEAETDLVNSERCEEIDFDGERGERDNGTELDSWRWCCCCEKGVRRARRYGRLPPSS